MSKELSIINENPVELKNAGLKAATESIIAIGGEIRANLYKVAAIMSNVAENKLYEEDGFKNVTEWAKKCLGFKKSQTYALCKIGKEYTADNMLESKLIHEQNNDFSVTQVVVMFPLGTAEKMDEAIAENDITPDMTVAEIKKKVKAITSDEDNEEKVTETEEATDEAESEVKEEEPVKYAIYTRFATEFKGKEQEFVYRGWADEYSLESIKKIVESVGVKCGVKYIANISCDGNGEPCEEKRNYVELENGSVIVIKWEVATDKVSTDK